MDRSPACLTLILQAFKNRGGFEAIVRILDQLVDTYNKVQSLNGPSTPADATKSKIVASSIDVIVNFFLHVVTPKTILEASQTTAMASRDRARDKQDYFAPSQFLVELKMAVLIPVQALLGSKFVEGAPGSTIKKLVDTLRIILESEHEQGAFKRSENILRRVRVPPKPWKEAADRLERLVGSGYSEDVAREALFRCNDNMTLAEDYCAFMKRNHRVGRNPIPGQVGHGSSVAPQIPLQPAAESSLTEAGPPETTNSASGNATSPITEQSTIQDRSPMEIDITEDAARSLLPPHPSSVGQLGDESALGTLTFENFLDLEGDPGRPRPGASLENDGSRMPGQSSVPSADSDITAVVVTADDLEEKRVEIRGRIIELALDVLNVHSGITFELADLILAAVPKSSQADSVRTEIGETLVQSLISLQADDFRNVSKKIAAYAHLLALILRDKAFYEATLKEVRSSLPALLDFIKVFPDQTLEESSPWISEILLVLEALLSDDAQPRQVKWTPPSSTTSAESSGAAELEEPVMPEEHKTRLFDAVLDILPRVGRDSSLALSVVRVLVMLSRNSQLAARLGEKRNLQRLFVMIKQLAGLTSGKLQSAFMLVLRHIVEDDDTIRQIMRSAIRSYFENRTSTRQVDTHAYVRNFSHLVLRSPELFVEVSNEILKLSRFDPSQRQQHLVLKHPPASANATENGTGGESHRQPEETGKGDVDNVLSQHGTSVEETPAPKASAAEATAAMVEHPDGVIHYLLSELLSYKEVHARETASGLKEKGDTAVDHQAADTEMTDREPSSSSPSGIAPGRTSEGPQAPGGSGFRAEEHPIFVYHCFILQCLTELLSSYTRTKVEFINFSRKASTQAQSLKPRSGILNYFFHDLIPVGTLSQTEDLPFLKKSLTSSWAISVIVALCAKTSEKYTSQDNPAQEHIDDPALAFVRKFVLEHALKAYNSTASVESLDARYSKILSLADMFNRILLGSPASGGGDANETYHQPKVIAQLMLERNFIHALTASIAEIDLNYPLAKRAVKYVLRPLEVLTRSAVELNETISISSFTGQPEDDEIPSASSISDVDEGREETPDLFRNSTLGLFEPGREDDTSSSASDDDEDALYDEQYGDEMDYEEDMADENEMSDEEGMSDIEGLPGDVGLDVEVVVDPDDDGDEDENDEDSPDDEESSDDEDEMNEMDAEGDGQSIGEDQNGEWESDNDDDDEDEDEDDNDEDEDDEEVSGFDGSELQGGNADSRNQSHDNPLQHIVRALGGGEDDSGMLQQLGGGNINMELDTEGFMEDDMQEDEGTPIPTVCSCTLN
jgi:E3 ubiquitin-protein ligase HUWE1